MLPRNSSGEMAPWLWWLDEKTGRWRQLEEMRPTGNSRTKRASGGRRFYIGDIQTDKISVINIDIMWKRCYVRAQAYVITGKELEPAQGVVVTLIGKDDANREQYYGYTQEVTNKKGIACIPAWCDSNVFLQSSGLFLLANGSRSFMHINLDTTILETLPSELEASIVQGKESSSYSFTAKAISQAGPVFRVDEVNKCHDPADNLLAFKYVFKGENKVRSKCYVRVQAYTVSGKNIEPAFSGKTGFIWATLISKANYEVIHEYYVNGYGMTCVTAWCDDEVILQASNRSFIEFNRDNRTIIYLNADKTTLKTLPPELDASIISKSFTFKAKETSQTGPVFKERSKCVDPYDNLLAFKFYLLIFETKKKPSEVDEFGSRPPSHPLSWYTSDAARPNQEPKKCFVKFKIYFYKGTPASLVSVESFTAVNQTRYGFSIKRATITGEGSPSQEVITNPYYETKYAISFVCVEYRCSEKDRETFIVVKLLTDRCFLPYRLYRFAGQVPVKTHKKRMNTPWDLLHFGFSAPADVSDGTLGLYTGFGKIAQERCQAGTVDDIGGDRRDRKPRSDGYVFMNFYECDFV